MPRSPSARSPDRARQAAETAGRRAERLAAWYLRLKGYRIIESRYRTPVGEIDLIARRFGTTVFVEVKARKSATLERDAHLSVHVARIVRAAKYYVARHPKLAQSTLRFDLIFLAPGRWPRHVMNAFFDNAD